jgi:hypothetical protein
MVRTDVDILPSGLRIRYWNNVLLVDFLLRRQLWRGLAGHQ